MSEGHARKIIIVGRNAELLMAYNLVPLRSFHDDLKN